MRISSRLALFWMNIGLIFRCTETVNSFTSAISTKARWFKTCKECLPKDVEKKTQGPHEQWQETEQKCHLASVGERWKREPFQRLSVTEKLKKLVAYMIEIYQKFLKHSYIKQSQAESFKLDRQSVNRYDQWMYNTFRFPTEFYMWGAKWNPGRSLEPAPGELDCSIQNQLRTCHILKR